MDLAKILSELKAKRDALDDAMEAISFLDRGTPTPDKPRRGRPPLSRNRPQEHHSNSVEKESAG